MSRYLEVKNQIAELNSQLDALRQEELGPTVEDMRMRIKEFGITPSMLFSTEELGQPPAPEPKRRAGRPRKPPQMYRLNGHTWDGKGPRPEWFNDALLRGVRVEEMLVTSKGEQS